MRSALVFAVRCHARQRRKSDGAAFIEHPLEVAGLLHDAGCSDVVVAAGLLHDVVEDSHVTVAELTWRFGAEVASLVQAVSEDSTVDNYRHRKRMLREQVGLERVTGRKLKIWLGECHVHAGIRPADIERWQREAPDAELLVHPECGCASQAMAFANDRTHILSAEGMVDFARKSLKERFVVATETGILHRLNREVPEKRFEAVQEAAVCRFMKMITLEKLRDCLRDNKFEVTVPQETADRARLAIERMVAIG